ncbi:ABC transporter family substrate-binding protein [Gordonia sp. PS3]|uniref:ABC transporter family substrate-binding protein n=1 Tax=Gordonia TaxID=2053 RepID=UPI00061F17CC|nr:MULTISPECIES: ABC transporter family substrate-binding protein [Gordonia]KJR08061.1 ABC transporter substrate-binding protein [Gordonia sihwensis]KXT57670.1 ABC transporter substrate-binding protein [Gordonia sp. QH-12]MBY4570925.1 ABC transporter substrate-binding protein [Gordonia sihwensis]WFN91854.1 ABC transporter family substrate-binding protein [Gordonia sihwensis]
MRTVRTRITAIAVTGLIGLSATACMADPPPPVRETLPTHTPNEYPDERTVTVATDSIGSGFNPHLGADQGTVTTAIAAMTLPSPFVPVNTQDGVQWRMNDALLTSAEVTSYDPFTVEYKIVNDAQWSDGLPVTGDDFHYLWEQMSRQPNVIGPAGYRAISDVQTSGGGKVVTVTFNNAYPAWRELFDNLLPSHTLRSDPTGFQVGMDKGKPVTAGPFQIYSIDRARDEVRLIRNDRYWRKPPEVDQVVLRKAGTPQQMAQTIRNGDSTLAALPSGAASAAELGAIPGVVSSRLPTTRALAVNANSRSETMRSQQVRKAVLGMLDGRLITAAAAGETVVTPFANTVYAPSDPGYTPVERPRPTQDEVLALLASAGYRPGVPTPRPAPADPSASSTASPTTPAAPAPADVPGLPYGVSPIQSNGTDLVVRIGATNTDQRTMSAAETMADQLRSRGVRASVIGMSNTELYGQALTSGRVDLVVGWTGVGGSPATELASQVACQAPPKGTEAGAHTVEPEHDQAADETVLPTVPSGAPSSTAKPEANVSADESYTGNISGLCDPTLIALADAAMSSEDPAPQLQEAEGLLADQAVYLPIFQDTMFSAVTDRISGVSLDGPMQLGVFGGADGWVIQ